MTSSISYFGIRHHGPGCASSLRKAFEELNPDCVLIEGPAGAETLLPYLSAEQMKPPVALLSYCVDEPQVSVFHPFAEFSPEWQAMQWAVNAQVPVQFIDVSSTITLAIQKEKRDAEQAAQQASQEHATQEQITSEIDDGEEDLDELETLESESNIDLNSIPHNAPNDPLDWLAHAAGYSDGESWWNHMVEERGDGEDLFEAITQAMTELRTNPAPDAPARSKEYETRETMREAHMRIAIKQAQKEGFERIAVVCGAWHVPALMEKVTLAADKAVFKEITQKLPKLKTQMTWVPWTYEHLSAQSGYSAGISSPGWYEFLWQTSRRTHDSNAQGAHACARAIGWFARIARLLRERDLDCSSAHLIEAARLADTLAAMRQRPAPSLVELNEAALSVILNGDGTPMQLIERELMIGRAIGSVPSDVPTVPLQKDLQAQQKSLRLKPEALDKEVDLDLRKENDLARSHLLHRLNLLGINWGTLTNVGQKNKGTFHEYWRLAWQPHFEVDIIIASRYGHTVEVAASTHAIEQAQKSSNLSELTDLIDKVLLANLPRAVKLVAHELQERSASSADPLDLLAALPALANVYRYGNVRQTDVEQVAHLFDSMLLRAVIGLPLAVANINEQAAEAARESVIATERAVNLRAGVEQTQAWQKALQHIATAQSSAALLRGVSCRLLLDGDVYDIEEARRQLSLSLSSGSDSTQAAQWLDGFLNRNAAVLLHNDTLWALIDEWLTTLNDEHFTHILPLVRRTFSEFEAADRRDLGQRVKQASTSLARKKATDVQHIWSEKCTERTERALPAMAALLGLPLEGITTGATPEKAGAHD